MAVTGSTTATDVDEQRPRWRKFCGCNGFQRDSVFITKPVGYVNPFFLKNGTAAKKNSTFFCQNGSRSWLQRLGLVINGCYNGFQWKEQRKLVQRPFPFR